MNKEISVLIFLLPAGMYFASAGWGRTGTAILLVMCLILLAFTVSQAAQLAIIVGAIAFAVSPFFPGRHRAGWIGAGTILIAGLWASPFVTPYMFKHAGLFRASELLVESSASQRLEIWDFIGRKIQEAPFLGQGMYATRFIEDFETAQIYYYSSTLMHPHNAALQLWLEFGVLGAIAGTAAIALFLWTCYRTENQPAQRLYLTVFCMLFLVALLGWGMWQAWWLGTVFAVSGMTILAGRHTSQKSPGYSAAIPSFTKWRSQ
jgi:O-antigen ligase